MEKLKQEALDACGFRGHIMGVWDDYRPDAAVCECIRCGAQAAITLDPLPNGIEIGGEAVAMHCAD